MIKKWLAEDISIDFSDVVPLAGDASFRHYFRVMTDKGNFVAMDAPVEKENSLPFVAIDKAWLALGLRVPKIYEANLDKGFFLLEDFGDDLYLKTLNSNTANELYGKAMADLAILQTCTQVEGWNLPRFNRDKYMHELSRFQEWYLEKYLKLQLTQNEKDMLQHTFDFLIETALSQPQVCVHKDYHSRNLMKLENGDMGILDFQDALWGPITYDLMSLLRDSYIHWPSEQITKWIKQFYQQCVTAGVSLPDVELFQRWFDVISVQRYLKVLYIFSRLKLLYNNPNYTQYIPRVLAYLMQVMPNYNELSELKLFFETRVFPHESDVACRRAGQTLREING